VLSWARSQLGRRSDVCKLFVCEVVRVSICQDPEKTSLMRALGPEAGAETLR